MESQREFGRWEGERGKRKNEKKIHKNSSHFPVSVDGFANSPNKNVEC